MNIPQAPQPGPNGRFSVALAKVCLIAFVVVLVDQISKAEVAAHLRQITSFGGPYDRIVVIPHFFDIVHHRNYGAAFGIMQGHRIFFIVATVAAIGLLFWMFRSSWRAGERRVSRLLVWGLFVGGAVGNLIDRVRGHGVVDFLHFYFAPIGDYPTFNVADSCITIGIVLLIVYSLPLKRHKHSEDHGHAPLPD